ncbi:hypothetical protein B0H16DRAFT_1461261 [Mycena metata]|uniref:Uncharacterized protein n=1 Tax=Mycena metata TaxID=1033252 RepID=A0AAD7IU76_9AGAR|nr:hypothetical protein B0H16DRAFT_1461261 [Mycena metata]
MDVGRPSVGRANEPAAGLSPNPAPSPQPVPSPSRPAEELLAPPSPPHVTSPSPSPPPLPALTTPTRSSTPASILRGESIPPTLEPSRSSGASAQLVARLAPSPQTRAPPVAPRAMLRPLEQRISFAPPRTGPPAPPREIRPLPQRTVVPLYNRLSSATPLGARLGPRSGGLLERLSITPNESVAVERPDGSNAGKRKRETESPPTPTASSSRVTLDLMKSGAGEETRAFKKVRRGKRAGKLVKEYEQRKAERANRGGTTVDEGSEERETQAHLESVLQTVAEVAEAEDALAIEWDGEVAPAWAPEEEEDDSGPSKM